MIKGFTIIWESWRNVRFLRKRKQLLTSSRPAMAGEELKEAYERLKSAAKDDIEQIGVRTNRGQGLT